MIVFGHRTFPLDTLALLRAAIDTVDALPVLPRHDSIVSLLVDIGEAASAVADAMMPRDDDDEARLGPWADATSALAAALAASWAGDRDAAHRFVASARSIFATLAAQASSAAAPSRTVEAKAAEGFAYHGLYPEQYLEAADRFARDHAPGAVLCVGIRSIGWTLAHVAAAALHRRGVDACVVTVRPRGHPFDRSLAMTPRFAQRIVSSRASHVLVVDEGPGLSGSSFAAVCDAVEGLGVSPDRVVLVPSWPADPAMLRSERGRRAWTSHAVATARFEDVWMRDGRLSRGRPLHDISAGAWRARVFGTDEKRWPAVQPQHERRRDLVECGEGRRLLKFAGLGRYGRARRARGARIADAGFTPSPGTLRKGFLEREWLDGTIVGAPMPRADLDRVAQYLAFLAREFTLAEADDRDALLHMTRVNAVEALGSDAARGVDAIAAWAAPPARRVAIDGRLLPHEWLRTSRGLVKIDALDHHDDDFFPGCRDIAWDVAAACLELARGHDAAEWLVDRYARASRDRDIRARLPVYEAAYLAWRAGYTTLAAESLGTSPDAGRFRREAARYRRLLASRVAPRRRARRR